MDFFSNRLRLKVSISEKCMLISPILVNLHYIRFWLSFLPGVLPLLFFLVIMSMFSCTRGFVEVKVADFGAVPNDGKNDTPAIRAAIKACQDKPGVRLVFIPGTYDMHGETPTDTRTRLEFEAYDDLTIEGNGAEIIGHELANLFAFSNCSNITIRNLTIDWDPLPFTEGRIIAIEGNHFDMEVTGPHIARAGLGVDAILGYDPEAQRLSRRYIDHYQKGS